MSSAFANLLLRSIYIAQKSASQPRSASPLYDKSSSFSWNRSKFDKSLLFLTLFLIGGFSDCSFNSVHLKSLNHGCCLSNVAPPLITPNLFVAFGFKNLEIKSFDCADK